MLPPTRSLVAIGLMALCLAGCSSGPFGQLQPTNCGTPYEFRRCASHAHAAYAPVTPTALPATPAIDLSALPHWSAAPRLTGPLL